jgi:hypothetical protein
MRSPEVLGESSLRGNVASNRLDTVLRLKEVQYGKDISSPLFQANQRMDVKYERTPSKTRSRMEHNC